MNKLIKTILLTATALIAFAANSVLCKMALGENAIDASSFTIIRLLSGAIVLAIVLKIRKNGTTITKKGSWFSSSMLFLYAITFSFAYISLDTGTGALIMFGAVQITMISISIINGNRLHLSEWIGVVIAFLGFVYLILPGVNAPSPTGFDHS
jgi:drug/metabolite transporter (DMT)-like permease